MTQANGNYESAVLMLEKNPLRSREDIAYALRTNGHALTMCFNRRGTSFSKERERILKNRLSGIEIDESLL